MRKILIAGASGFLGEGLIHFLKPQGYEIYRLVRNPGRNPHEIYWNPSQELVHLSELEGFDVVINLAGENIAAGRWTKEKMQRILTSRVETTGLLAQVLPNLTHPPKVWINASSIGFYGDTGDQIVREGSPYGSGFLADVTVEWENAAKVAEGHGIRIVFLRTGVVLNRQGGLLKRMMLPFKMGLGGVVGSGKQYMSWISLEDFVQAVLFLCEQEVSGPVNLVVPRAVTNYEFTKTLGKVLKRPTFFPLPSWVAKLVFGKMADELLLSSTRVEPRRLMDMGFHYRFPSLEPLLRANISDE